MSDTRKEKKNSSYYDTPVIDAGQLKKEEKEKKKKSTQKLCWDCESPYMKRMCPKRMSGMVYTGVEVHRMDSEMSGLVERSWLQLMCCAVCLPHGRNFR